MNDIVLLNLRISMWGVSRVLPDHEYEVDADKAMVRATKKILECPEYEFLLQLKRSIHRRLKTLALPGTPGLAARTYRPRPLDSTDALQSSFRIVPMPRFLVNSELPLLPNTSR